MSKNINPEKVRVLSGSDSMPTFNINVPMPSLQQINAARNKAGVSVNVAVNSPKQAVK